MNCTNCGKVLEEAICSRCSRDHRPLLYKLADDAQVRRDYSEAYDYMDLVRKSTTDQEELSSIDRTMAKLGFSQTDLTGNTLKRNKRKVEGLKVLKFVFSLLVVVSIMLIGYYIYENNSTKNKFEIIEVK
jgi:arylamine N-acetyltransferase